MQQNEFGDNLMFKNGEEVRVRKFDEDFIGGRKLPEFLKKKIK